MKYLFRSHLKNAALKIRSFRKNTSFALPFAFNSSICKQFIWVPITREVIKANDINGKEFWPQGNDFEFKEIS